ncbi:MAG: Zn-ribbon domain-containing OB-fold protein [Acidobacteria bacterium]|nr:Zn-ribbon domain-containing OB-fold protein [Acidobacteriota bacterium]MDW7984265.1 Zn-ribbon domain-containing OB-fold protein [Acidobacteriota bacterium]
MPLKERIPHLHEVRSWRGSIQLEGVYTVGVAGERWLQGLQEGRIYGTRCLRCRYTYVPARLFCERCLGHLGEDAWIEVGPQGTLMAWTQVHVAPDGQRLSHPRCIGLVRLDRADALMVHELQAEDRPLQVGLRVEAVFRSPAERVGSLRDVAYFRPLP